MKPVFVFLIILITVIECTTKNNGKDEIWWRNLADNNGALRIFEQWHQVRMDEDRLQWTDCLEQQEKQGFCFELLLELLEKYSQTPTPQDQNEFQWYLEEGRQLSQKLANILNFQELPDLMTLHNALSPMKRGNIQTAVLQIAQMDPEDHAKFEYLRMFHMVTDVLRTDSCGKPVIRIISSLRYCQLSIKLLEMFKRDLWTLKSADLVQMISEMPEDQCKLDGLRMLSIKEKAQNFRKIFDIVEALQNDTTKTLLLLSFPLKHLYLNIPKVIQIIETMSNDDLVCESLRLIPLRQKDVHLNDISRIIKNMNSDFYKIQALTQLRKIADKHAIEIFNLAKGMPDELMQQVLYLFSVEGLYRIATRYTDLPQSVFERLSEKARLIQDPQLKLHFLSALPPYYVPISYKLSNLKL